MQEASRGLFSEQYLGSLVDLLKEVGRVDLAMKCEQFVQQQPAGEEAQLIYLVQGGPH
jgi:glutathione peroxidase-family protein